MICLECGKQVRSINYLHLRSCSGLSPAEYRARHPGAVLIDDDVRASISGRWSRIRAGKDEAAAAAPAAVLL
jgi:hypothetical protein